MRWRVQFGINSASDVWKFCQNWTSRRDEFNMANGLRQSYTLRRFDVEKLLKHFTPLLWKTIFSVNTIFPL